MHAHLPCGTDPALVTLTQSHLPPLTQLLLLAAVTWLPLISPLPLLPSVPLCSITLVPFGRPSLPLACSPEFPLQRLPLPIQWMCG